MGQGSYVIAEWESVAKEYPQFQQSLKTLEAKMIEKCVVEWAPKTFSLAQPFGGNNNWGRTTILPALFDNGAGVQLVHWRQRLNATGHQTLLAGTRAGNTIPEDFKIAWVGLAFPNKNQYITEIKWQIGDRKYGRINIEEMLSYNKPAIIFEEGFIIDEEQSFDLYGYAKGPIPSSGYMDVRMVMLGFCAYKLIDRALGNCGAAI